jgi:hypothetical protein
MNQQSDNNGTNLPLFFGVKLLYFFMCKRPLCFLMLFQFCSADCEKEESPNLIVDSVVPARKAASSKFTRPTSSLFLIFNILSFSVPAL